MKSKVAIVTGAARGLGQQMALGLAEAGAKVVIADIDKKEAQANLKKFSGVREQPAFIKVDVTKEREVIKMVEQTLSKEKRIDILVNNAGIAIKGLVENLELKSWNRLIEMDLTSVFLCCKHVGRQMIKQKKGKIINIASIWGRAGSDINYDSAYPAAKGGVVNFTRDLAVKWAKYDINVNAICPGFFDTALSHQTLQKKRRKILSRIPLRRVGGRCDLKGAAVFLSSSASDYVTGCILNVDGGWLAV